MGFEVAPTRPGRGHGIRAMVVVGVTLVLTIAIALLTRSGAPASHPGSDLLTGVAGPGASARAGSAGAFAGGTTSVGPAVSRAFPRVISCYRTVGDACRQIVRAALDDLPADAPPVRAARVWGSLICDDDRDCSASRLVGYRPLGSTVLTFGPAGPEVWVNVTEPAASGTLVGDPTDIQAWIVRWFADPVSS